MIPPRVDDPLADLTAVVQACTPEQLDALTAGLDAQGLGEVERIVADVTRSGWRSSPLALGVKLELLDDLPHSRLLSDKFADAVMGRSSFQIWNLPPQHGKSLIGSRMGPAWAFDIDPTIKLALTSYGDLLAGENAAFVRNLLVEHPDVFSVELRVDARRRDRFVTSEGGGLIAAGVGSGLTGFGAHGIVVDDPFKNWEDAHSEARRELIWNWFRSVVLTRQNHRRGIPFFCIIVMTRWHEDDLTGKLVAQQLAGDGAEWELVVLPAIAETSNDLLGRKPGDALAPSLHSAAELEQTMTMTGSYLSAGLYQQRPAPEEGTDIMRSWWKYEALVPPRFDAEITSWDMKLKDKEAGDFVVGGVLGRVGADFWITDVLRGQWNQPTTKVAIVLLALRHPHANRHIVENTGNGPEVMAELRKGEPGYVLSEAIIGKLGITAEEVPRVERLMRRGLPGLIPENVPPLKKRVRMRAYTGLIESGHVHVPEGALWVPAFIDETAAFPNGAHDDQIDMLSQGLKRLSQGQATTTRARGQIRTPAPSARATRVPATGRAPRVPRR